MNFLDFSDSFMKEAENYGSYDLNIPIQYRVIFKLLDDGDYTYARSVLESNPENFTGEYSYLILDTAIEMCLNRVIDENNTRYDDEQHMIKEHTYRPEPDSVEFIGYLLMNGANPHLPEHFDQLEHINDLEKDCYLQTGFRFDCSEIRQLLKRYW